jgi:hypothetical protein
MQNEKLKIRKIASELIQRESAPIETRLRAQQVVDCIDDLLVAERKLKRYLSLLMLNPSIKELVTKLIEEHQT